MMSQGTADLLLDVCTDFWDGKNLCPLSDFERLVSSSDLIFRTEKYCLCPCKSNKLRIGVSATKPVQLYEIS